MPFAAEIEPFDFYTGASLAAFTGGAIPPAHYPRVVAFCGLAGSGKTTAADWLVNHHGYERVRFAGPLKAMLRALGLTESEVDGADKERPSALLGGKTPRQAMQWLGTEFGRELIDNDLWVRAWDAAAGHVLARGGRVVVDDVRFMNEASAIWARGGTLFKIVSPRASAGTPAHVSEELGFPWDAEIANDGVDLQVFRAAIAKALDAHSVARAA